MEQKVIYNGQILTLTHFWATGEPCLWITDPQQIGMPKMEFVGGHPDEYCIFLKNGKSCPGYLIRARPSKSG